MVSNRPLSFPEPPVLSRTVPCPFWRYSGSATLSDYEAITNAVPQSVYNQVIDSIYYRKSMLDEEAEFMSKLTLQFYLDMLDQDDTDPEAFSTLQPGMLVYDERNGAAIEPGGRVIVTVKGNGFTIPADADSGLMYIGLDENFNPVTDVVYT